MKYKIFESEEGLEDPGKIHPVKITKYGKGFMLEQKITSDELSRREWDNINAKPEEKARLYREKQSRFMRRMFDIRLSKAKKINYEPVNIESFNEKHETAQELFRQDQVRYFDNEGLPWEELK